MSYLKHTPTWTRSICKNYLPLLKVKCRDTNLSLTFTQPITPILVLIRPHPPHIILEAVLLHYRSTLTPPPPALNHCKGGTVQLSVMEVNVIIANSYMPLGHVLVSGKLIKQSDVS